MVAAHLLEGHVVLMVDNSPSAMLFPATLFHFTQHSEDYYQNPLEMCIRDRLKRAKQELNFKNTKQLINYYKKNKKIPIRCVPCLSKRAAY